MAVASNELERGLIELCRTIVPTLQCVCWLLLDSDLLELS